MSEPSEPSIPDEFLAVWFTPDAIRDHFDGAEDDDDPRLIWAMSASDEDLREVGNGCVSDDAMWSLFHVLIEENIDAVMAERKAKGEHHAA